MPIETRYPLLATVLIQCGEVEMTAGDDSMYPAIRKGDVCTFVAWTKDRPIVVGDIVLFVDRSNCLLAHRLLRMRRQGDTIRYLFKGDCKDVPESPVYPEQLIGRLTQIRRGARVISANGWLFRAIGRLTARYPAMTKLWQFICPPSQSR